MEPDSTTEHIKSISNESSFPFPISSGNYKLYEDLTEDNGIGSLESQIVERLQCFGLLIKDMTCPLPKPDCNAVCRIARVIDRVQWVCDTCGTRQAVRKGSFFAKLQCSILQALQIILAWSEDVDWELAGKHFGVKPRTVINIYEKLDKIAIKEHKKKTLGGDNSVVLAEMYPDCLNRLSPDTTDQPHSHKIIMLADTNHIPTQYWLHVVKDYPKRISNRSSIYNKALEQELEDLVSKVADPNSTLVTGNNVPHVEGASSIQQLVQFCDTDMQHFLTSRIWRQAITLCGASRDICGVNTLSCGTVLQQYLHASLYRLQHQTEYYPHILRLIASELVEIST